MHTAPSGSGGAGGARPTARTPHGTTAAPPRTTHTKKVGHAHTLSRVGTHTAPSRACINITTPPRPAWGRARHLSRSTPRRSEGQHHKPHVTHSSSTSLHRHSGSHPLLITGPQRTTLRLCTQDSYRMRSSIIIASQPTPAARALLELLPQSAGGDVTLPRRPPHREDHVTPTRRASPTTRRTRQAGRRARTRVSHHAMHYDHHITC